MVRLKGNWGVAASLDVNLSFLAGLQFLLVFGGLYHIGSLFECVALMLLMAVLSVKFCGYRD